MALNFLCENDVGRIRDGGGGVNARLSSLFIVPFLFQNSPPNVKTGFAQCLEHQDKSFINAE